jgi:hypothetical protein
MTNKKYKDSNGRWKETFGSEALTQDQVDKICETYNVSVKNNCFVFGPPKTERERLLNQVTYWIANDNFSRSRELLKSIKFTTKMINAYINDEVEYQKRHPKDSGHLEYKNKPMPDEFRVGIN